MVDATQSLARLREDVGAAAEWAGGGGLAAALTTHVTGPLGGGKGGG